MTRLDRLARSTRDLLNLLASIAEKGAGFKSLGDAWANTTTPHGRLMLTVLGGLAEFERELIRTRTREGTHEEDTMAENLLRTLDRHDIVTLKRRDRDGNDRRRDRNDRSRGAQVRRRFHREVTKVAQQLDHELIGRRGTDALCLVGACPTMAANETRVSLLKAARHRSVQTFKVEVP